MNEPPSRVASLVLVDAGGNVLGQLPAIPVATPWWQDMPPLLSVVEARDGLRPTILRILTTERARSPGGAVTYLGEVGDEDYAAAAALVAPWPGGLDEQPLRASWARPGGPRADLAWAQDILAEVGRPPAGPPLQMRTWNLSSIWRLPTADGAAWLKVVPPFFVHEGALIERLGGGPMPVVLGREGGRVLMDEIAGDDRYDAHGPELLQMISALVGLQEAWLARTEELLALGLPDMRGPSLAAGIGRVVERAANQLSAADRTPLERFAERLPERFLAIEGCGLPDTLVHGDFAPGNVRGDGTTLPMTILDWGDSVVGHPMLDLAAFLDRTPSEDAESIRTHWYERWRHVIPGSQPEQAASLIAPVASARQALIYYGFLDRIEPAEHPYHAADPLDWLERTAALLRDES